MKRKMKLLAMVSASLMAANLSTFAQPTAKAKGSVSYNRDIRPILTENCFACHGPDSAARKADLRLDLFSAATAPRTDSKPAITPGKPDQSSILDRVFTHDEDDIMPPTSTKKTLQLEDKEKLKQWVQEGAQYEEHWAFQAPAKPALPAVKKQDWVQSPIDAFVLAQLEAKGLSPAPEADRPTLARRLSLDLTGLPPSAEMVKAFVNDKSPDAYEKLVNQLLNSERYGEHRARYWLDAARYADTHGIHFDNYREIWSYRNWVIDAFNQNMPFDQFTIEQLAGDLLPKPTLDQKIATGFNRCNMTTSEGGAIDEEYRMLYTRDRTETTAAVWLGITANCAACHDHKYDPLTQKEVYEMSAFFNNTTQPAMDGNRKDSPPTIPVPKDEDRSRWAELPLLKKDAKQRVDRRRQNAVDDYSNWLSKLEPSSLLKDLPSDGLQFAAPLKESFQPAITVMVNGYPKTLPLGNVPEGAIAPASFITSRENVPAIPEAGNFERTQPFSAGLWIRMNPDDKQGSAFARMNEDEGHRGWDLWIEDGRPGIHIVSKWPEDALKVVARGRVEPNKWAHVFVTYDGTSKAEGVKVYINGKLQDVERPSNQLKNTIVTQTPFKIGQRNKGDQLDKAGIQDVRLYSRVLNEEEVSTLMNRPRLAYLASKGNSNRNEDEQKQLFDGYLNEFDHDFQIVTQVLASLEKEERDIRDRGTIAYIVEERQEPPTAFVLFRGEYDKKREKVDANTPAMFPPMEPGLPKNRYGFAKWLLQPNHPTTARVTVNRFWQELFGTGIVRTSGDFGVSGEMPSHPELLDFLAVTFRENGWDMKKFYKMVVMSATYRQDAAATEDKLAKDLDNRLLSRGPRFRMDGEMIRDYALAASGLLSGKIGGPSVKPYQPEGVWEMVAMPESNTRNYKQDNGEQLYRRSLYTFWKRSAPPASMDVFNAPSRETCTVRRERTNTPLQALATLNDPQMIEAARHLAEKTLKEAGQEQIVRLNFMAERLIARSLKQEEIVIVEGVLKELEQHYAASAEDAKALIHTGETKPAADLDPSVLAAYTMVANQLMNLDAVLNK
ncbi:MAG: DUF1553 domain-containing protein [Verrucomicrobiales bacterium]